MMKAVHLTRGLTISGFILTAGSALGAVTRPVYAATEVPSAFECNNLEKAGEIQLLEGKDGMFFRVIPDIKMYHPFTDATIDYVARISSALKAKGTTLIYVPVPTKSMILSDMLPEQAKSYGFDPAIANSIYDDVIERLGATGVLAVDIANPMRAQTKNPNGDLAFFRTDFHWTAQGSGPAAREIVRRLISLPGYAGQPKLDVEPLELPSEKISSTMRKIAQRYCRLPVPEARAHPYELTASASDIFGETPGRPLWKIYSRTAGRNPSRWSGPRSPT